MGRDSKGRGPTRSERGKQARNTINVTIPKVLKASARAKRGVESATLIVDPPAVPTAAASTASSQSNPAAGDGGRDSKPGRLSGPRITFRTADTLEVAREVAAPSPGGGGGRPGRVAVLNMASPLRPGGGILTGATSQEESLCGRTTLYPSLREEFYRLPEVGGVYTPDVLVFRITTADTGSPLAPASAAAGNANLDKADWFFVDVITAAMIRLPDVDDTGDEARYADEKNRELARRKMRAVLRMAATRGVTSLVLGAWGCGAYGNPVGEIANAWKRVLFGTARGDGYSADRRELDTWAEIDIIFAIKDGKMASAFQTVFEMI